MFHPQRNLAEKAFSMTEMLVSVAIIGILAAVLNPSIKGAMERSRNTKCLSNLRQVGGAMIAYATENDQKYPPMYNDTGNTSGLTWMWQLKSYLGMPENSMGTAPLPRSAGVFNCPSMKPAATAQRIASYGINNYMSVASNKGWNYNRLAVPLTSTIIVTEINVNGEMYSPYSSGPVTKRHPGPSANYLFGDAHVENIKENIPDGDARWLPKNF